MTGNERPMAHLTLADVARHPRPGLTAPRRVEFTPDGQAITYLFSGAGTLEQQLWRYDLATGERRSLTGDEAGGADDREFTIEEQLRRERSRLRERGVTDYQFVREDGDGQLVLLVPLGGALWVRRGDGPLAALPGTEDALDARLSPNGRRVAFVRDDELWVTEVAGDAGPRRLTSGAGNGITNGVAEYIAQEEMGRREGYWWNPDSQQLAYEWADSGHIPIYPIVHQGKDEPAIEEHRYPFAGKPNARVQLGVVAASGEGEPRWLGLGLGADDYLARVAWRPDGTLTAQTEPRDQRSLRLVAFDGATGAATTLLEERGDPWINLADDLRFLPTGEFLWSSEQSGFRHLYLHAADGRELRALTAGEWMVTGVVALDAKRRVVYFQGTRDGVLERHLYRVSLDGGEIERITDGAGWHDTVVAPDAGLYLDRYGSLDAAPTLTLRRLAGNEFVATLFADESATAEALGLQPPELATFQTADGATLQAAIYAPPGAESDDARYPLIVAVYGGPHAQMVANTWGLTIDLRSQYLAQQGYVVLKVDNRGSANRGLRFEAPIAGDMGRIEVMDQVAGVRWISERPYVDGSRVGITGWSYGGYMTLLSLLRASEVFSVGVAGAPVTHWDGYDTHYTERYMGHPAVNAAGYRESSPLTHIAALEGKLLLIHGMVDENVHFRHTARLVAALTAADRPYDLVIYPEERHMPRDAKGLEYLERRLVDYFQAHL
jgi:dipeptidyl-peptidase-4